jgi:hypothetical protein
MEIFCFFIIPRAEGWFWLSVFETEVSGSSVGFDNYDKN